MLNEDKVITVYGLGKIHPELIESEADEGDSTLFELKFNGEPVKIRVLKEAPTVGVRIDDHEKAVNEND